MTEPVEFGSSRLSKYELVAQWCDVYRTTSAIANIVGAWYIPLNAKPYFKIESYWNSDDITKLQTTPFARTYFGTYNETVNVISSSIHDISTESKIAISATGNYKALLKEEKNGGTRQFIEIWSRHRKISTIDVLESKQHGKIYEDSLLGAFMWNDAEDTILYVAEKYRAKPVSYFKKIPDLAVTEEDLCETRGQEYVYYDDWGETLTGKTHSVICTMNVKSGAITVLPILEDEMVTLCQPIWSRGGESIYFVGYTEEPYRLGIKFCFNRPGKIYHFELESHNICTISEAEVSVRSPRISPDNVLVYVQNQQNGPHNCCSQLIKYSHGEKQTVMDIVKFSCGDSFPGIYVETLPERCFSNNGRYVFFSSIWRTQKVALAVDLKTCLASKIYVGNNVSCSILDVFDDVIVASASSFDIEPFLMAGKLSVENDVATVMWSNLDMDAPRKIGDIDWFVRDLEPLQTNSVYPHVDYDCIILTPICGSSIPIILFPHGGPHSAFVNTYDKNIAAFVKLGYAVCLVNYRGSTGCGQDGINALLGNVGSQDVSDVYNALKYLKTDKRFVDSDVFLYGGSHGGFIVAHLCINYRNEFAACVCRNPVIDISSMTEGSDIPDWAWVECGAGKKFCYEEPNSYALSEMWNRSPIRSAGKVRTPTLLILGKQDRRVPCSQGLKYARALKVHGIPVRVCMYEDHHAFTSIVAQSDSFMQTLAWFQKYKTRVPEIHNG